MISPNSDPQILLNAWDSCFVSPPAPIYWKPARMRLINANMPAATNANRMMLVIKRISPPEVTPWYALGRGLVTVPTISDVAANTFVIPGTRSAHCRSHDRMHGLPSVVLLIFIKFIVFLIYQAAGILVRTQCLAYYACAPSASGTAASGVTGVLSTTVSSPLAFAISSASFFTVSSVTVAVGTTGRLVTTPVGLTLSPNA